MLKSLIVATALLPLVSLAYAQAASEPAAAASTAKKKKFFHAPKLRKGATPAVNPQTSPDKKGGN